MSLSNPFQQALSLYAPPATGGITYQETVAVVGLDSPTFAEFTIPANTTAILFRMQPADVSGAGSVIDIQLGDDVSYYTTGYYGAFNVNGTAIKSPTTMMGPNRAYCINFTNGDTTYFANAFQIEGGISPYQQNLSILQNITTPITRMKVSTNGVAFFVAGTTFKLSFVISG